MAFVCIAVVVVVDVDEHEKWAVRWANNPVSPPPPPPHSLYTLFSIHLDKNRLARVLFCQLKTNLPCLLLRRRRVCFVLARFNE